MGGVQVLLYLLVSSACLVSAVTYNRESHCYEDLLVALSPDLPQEEWQALRPGLESWLSSGSRLLNTATHGWAYVCTVKVLLPASWSQMNDTEPALSEVYTDAKVWVEGWDAVHGHAPFTLQPGECGEEGLYIQVSKDYLTDHASSFSDIFGPPGQVFLHEWARLRYGVFEEHGYPGDPIYPAFYHQQTWTAEGPKVEVKPAFCTDRQVEGQLVDLRPGHECEYDPATGLPDHNCYFFASGPEDLDSSVMALPYLKGNDHFCENGEEHIHHPDLPNKHNAMCGGRSVFDVVVQHADFTNYTQQPDKNNTNPTFTYLQPKASQKYVLVLDASSSMSNADRIGRLKKAANRFVKYNVEDGTPLGVVKFNSFANTVSVFDIAELSSENRDNAMKAIQDIKLSRQTCLGDALRKGLSELKGYNREDGGVMLFITDGGFSCKGREDIMDVIDDVIKQKVRVITMAMSNNADTTLETLAARTGGDAYFVPDGTDPGPINDAFSGSLNFQPEKQSKDKSVILLQETLVNTKSIQRNLTIDQFSGKDVNVQMDITSSEQQTVDVMIGNTNFTFSTEEGVFNKLFPILPAGNHMIRLTASKTVSIVTLKVESKAPEDSLPLITDCWTSLGEGDLDLPAGGRMAVLARVTQGQSPVVRARVVAMVDKDDSEDPVELMLSDDGTGPDKVADDGLYASYFTMFTQSNTRKRYTLKCMVEGTEDSSTHLGSPGSRSLPSRPSEENPLCCGSTALREDSVLVPTGAFTRSNAGGLISVLPTGDISNLYPPGNITDLRLGDMDFDQEIFSLNFTFPGDDLDQGTVDSYTIFYASNKTLVDGDDDLLDQTLLLNSTLEVDQLYPEQLARCSPTTNCSLPSPLAAGEKLGLELDMETFPKDRQLYWRVRVQDGGGKWATSNIATSYLQDTRPTGGADGRNLGWAAIVAGLVVLCIGY